MERMKIGMRLFHDRPFTRVVRRECARIAARKSLFLLMIPLPIVLFFLLALMYRNQVVVGIPVAVYDADHSELSRIVIRSVESTRSMKIVASLQSIDEITEEFRKGNIQGAVYIPGGFEGDVKHGRQARIIFYKNSFNLILGNSLLKDGTAIAKTISAGVLIKKFRSAGMSYQGALDLANPVRLESYSLFNPNYNYENYFVPCLVTAVLQMVVMIGAVLLVSTEYHEGTMAELFNAAGGKVSAVIAGKAIPHLFIHSASALCLIGILFPLFGIPLAGSVLFDTGIHGGRNSCIVFPWILRLVPVSRPTFCNRAGSFLERARRHLQRIYVSLGRYAGGPWCIRSHSSVHALLLRFHQALSIRHTVEIPRPGTSRAGRFRGCLARGFGSNPHSQKTYRCDESGEA